MPGFEEVSSKLDAIELIFLKDLPHIRIFDNNYAECDVNSLAYNFMTKQVIDPFQTGRKNAINKKFRLVADTIETWHEAKFGNREVNGKMNRLFKLLALGMDFADPDQKRQFVNHFPQMWDDYAAKKNNAKVTTVRLVLGQTVRGDIINFRTGKFDVGTDQKKVEKYNQCILAAMNLDPIIGFVIQKFMEQGDKQGYDMEIEKAHYEVLSQEARQEQEEARQHEPEVCTSRPSRGSGERDVEGRRNPLPSDEAHKEEKVV